MAKENIEYHNKMTLEGDVFRIDSKRPDDYAVVHVRYKDKTFQEKIAVERLLDVDLAWCGAEFFYVIEDNGATRTETIKPNIEANKGKRQELSELLSEFKEVYEA